MNVQENHPRRSHLHLGTPASVARPPALGEGTVPPFARPLPLNVPVFAVGRHTALRQGPATPIHDPELRWLDD